MNENNIGSQIRELFFEISEGLQGEIPGRLRRTASQYVEETMSKWDAQEIRDSSMYRSSQNSNFFIFAINNKPGIYNVKTWYNTEELLEHYEENNLPLPQISRYKSLQRLKSLLKTKNEAGEAAYERLKAKTAQLGINFFDFKKIGKNRTLRPLSLESQTLSDESRDIQDKIDKLRGHPIYAFRNLDESQIHFYSGNRPGDFPINYAKVTTPLTRENLGDEIICTLEEHLRNPSQGDNKDLCESISPWVLGKKNGRYSVKLSSVSGPMIFRNISLRDIRKLVE